MRFDIPLRKTPRQSVVTLLGAILALTILSASEPAAAAPAIPVKALKACKRLHPDACPALARLASDKQAAALGLKMLAHEDPWIRRAGARLFMKTRDAHAVAPLSKLLADTDADVRAAALDALGVTGAADNSPAILAALAREKNIAVRTAAVRAIGRLGAPEAGKLDITPLLTALDDADAHLAATAADALGRLGDRRAVLPLATVLADPRRRGIVQVAAASALGRLGDKEGAPALFIAVDSPDIDLRRAAILGLGALDARGAVDLLILQLSDSVVLVETVKALGAIQDPRALDPLLAILRASDLPSDVREAVVHAIGRRKVVSAVPALLAMLRDERPPLSVAILRALGDIGDERAMSRLLEALESTNAEVVGAANTALCTMTGQRFDPDPKVWHDWLAQRSAPQHAP